eukprot:scaffold17430_cov36-Attheya_sp.AAC.2
MGTAKSQPAGGHCGSSEYYGSSSWRRLPGTPVRHTHSIAIVCPSPPSLKGGLGCAHAPFRVGGPDGR